MNLSRLLGTLARLRQLPSAERDAAARRDHQGEPSLLAEILRLLPHLDAPESFLAPPAVLGAGSAGLFAQTDQPGRVFGDRWRIEGSIAQGGQGVVFAAKDVRTGRDVAVKVMHGLSVAEAARVRREAATLRWLDRPGVVRFLDFGEDGQDAWLVMEKVDGTPFPGSPSPVGWGQLAPLATALLDCVGRVHAAGVVHADLKPANVLVDGRGIVTVVDLGLSAARSEAAYASGTTTGGTLGYLAPEVAAGGAPTPESDLYSVGVILFHAMTGKFPGQDPDAETRELAAPATVRRAIAKLLRADPALRPRSSAEVLTQILGRASTRRAPWTVRELRGRFLGFERFHHVPSDAARAVLRHTRGNPVEVEHLIDSWLRTGFARIESGRVALDRPNLDRLLALLPGAKTHETPLTLALVRGTPWDVADTAQRVGERLLASGRAARALAAVEEGVVAARAIRDARREDRLLVLAVRAALTAGNRVELERALWLVQRTSGRGAVAVGLEAVLDAAAAFQRGDAPFAESRVGELTRTASSDVARLAWSVRALAAQALPIEHHRKVVHLAARWATRVGTRDAVTVSVSWRAWLRYREGRCLEAARLQRECAGHARDAVGRMRFLTDAAAAALDGGDLPNARQAALRAVRHARRLRRPLQEVRAHLVLRAARVADPDVRPDVASLPAIHALGSATQSASARVTEAAIAWRQGDLRTARSILEADGSFVDVATMPPLSLLLVALRAAATRAGTAAHLREVAMRALQTAPPAVAVQVIALVTLADPTLRSEFRRSLSTLRLPRAGRPRSRPREILSVAEAVALLQGLPVPGIASIALEVPPSI